MSIKEKVAYLKGLAEGLGLDPESKSEKLISVIIDTLSDIVDEIEELGENALDIGEELDTLSDDLADVEEFLFDNDLDDDLDDLDDFDDFDEDDEDEDDEDDDVFDDDESGCELCGRRGVIYTVECPSCNADIRLSDADLMRGSKTCSSCGELLEFDFDEDEDEEEEEAELGDDEEESTSAEEAEVEDDA